MRTWQSCARFFGRAVAKIADAFGMTVLVYTRTPEKVDVPYAKAVELNPEEVNAYILQGNLYSNLKLYLEAEKKYKDAKECYKYRFNSKQDCFRNR